jgi:hypothetical protein
LKVHYTEASLKQILLPDDKNRLFSDNAAAVGEDEQEMLNFILRKDGNSEPVTLAGLQTSFTGGQYGWYPMAVLAVLAKLFVRNSVEVREGGKLKSSEELFSILSRNRDYQNYLIKPAPIINSRDLEQFTSFYHEFFHKQPGTSVAKELSISFRQELLLYRNRLRDYYNLRSDFPFLEKLAGPIDEYGRIIDRDWSETIGLVLAKMNEYLESKEELEDPVVSFMEGDQHSIWLGILRYAGGHRDNIHEMDREKELAELDQLLASPAPYRGGVVKKAKALMEELKAAEEGYLKRLKEEKKREVAEAIEGLAGLPNTGN